MSHVGPTAVPRDAREGCAGGRNVVMFHMKPTAAVMPATPVVGCRAAGAVGRRVRSLAEFDGRLWKTGPGGAPSPALRGDRSSSVRVGVRLERGRRVRLDRASRWSRTMGSLGSDTAPARPGRRASTTGDRRAMARSRRRVGSWMAGVVIRAGVRRGVVSRETRQADRRSTAGLRGADQVPTVSWGPRSELRPTLSCRSDHRQMNRDCASPMAPTQVPPRQADSCRREVGAPPATWSPVGLRRGRFLSGRGRWLLPDSRPPDGRPRSGASALSAVNSFT